MKDKVKDKLVASRFPFSGRVALGIVGFALATCSGLLGAEKPYLVRDINESRNLDSCPRGLTALGDRLFFEADDGIHGRELWVTDGTPEGTSLVEDLCPGS